MSSDLRMWHVGNWCIHQGAKYIESPFEYPSKDVEIVNYAAPLIRALSAIPKAEVEKGRVSCWMTGASPHWGINFMKWREYDRFWMQLFTSKDG